MAKQESFQEKTKPSFEGAPTESTDVSDLKKRIEQLEKRLEREDVPEKEKIAEAKEEIRQHLHEFQETSPKALSFEERDEVEEISQFSKPQQISSLIDLAFKKGLEEAVNVAKNLDNPAILDEFHDTLVDRYYEKLIKREKI